MCYFAFQTHYNGDGGSSLIFVFWTGGVLALNQQAVSLFCCVHLELNTSLVFNQVWGHSFTLIMWYPNILQWWWRLCVDLCSLDAWNGWQIGRWPWTDSAYVCITACVWSHLKVLLVFDAVWGDILVTCSILLFKYTTFRHGGPGRIGRMFVLLCLCARIWRCYCLAFNTVWDYKFTLMHYFAVRRQWRLRDDIRFLNVWNGCRVGPEPTMAMHDSVMIFACWMHGTRGCRVGPEQTARTFCIVVVCEVDIEGVTEGVTSVRCIMSP